MPTFIVFGPGSYRKPGDYSCSYSCSCSKSFSRYAYERQRLENEHEGLAYHPMAYDVSRLGLAAAIRTWWSGSNVAARVDGPCQRPSTLTT